MGKGYEQELEVKMANDYIATCWNLLNIYKSEIKKFMLSSENIWRNNNIFVVKHMGEWAIPYLDDRAN